MKPAALAAGLVALACCAPARAQSFSDLALDGRPDRLQRLAAAAKKESALTLYTPIPEKDMAGLGAAFCRRHGGEGESWRASSGQGPPPRAGAGRADRRGLRRAALSPPGLG